ncbi:MAG: hypothetical protein M3O70_16205 [Actinomycetota bacterium]|nr:hypothetical protein [Actinomycetota bacterium]
MHGTHPAVTAQELIAGHREIIKRARAHGLTVIGATLLPFEGAQYFSERSEHVRDELNGQERGGDARLVLPDQDAPHVTPLTVTGMKQNPQRAASNYGAPHLEWAEW